MRMARFGTSRIESAIPPEGRRIHDEGNRRHGKNCEHRNHRMGTEHIVSAKSSNEPGDHGAQQCYRFQDGDRAAPGHTPSRDARVSDDIGLRDADPSDGERERSQGWNDRQQWPPLDS